MKQILVSQVIAFPYKAIGIVIGTLLLLTVAATPTVHAQSVIAGIRDPQCPGYTAPDIKKFTYATVDAAVKDTIPGEWWSPVELGGTITFSGLQAAAVMVRSRVEWNRLYPIAPGAYHYVTANVDAQGGVTKPNLCDDYTLNTAWNAQRHSRSNYNSNGATDSTAGVYIVKSDNIVAAVGFQPVIQKRSAQCAEQSDDWRFCAISPLGLDVSRSENSRVRRLNTASVLQIEFQAEAFSERIQRSNKYWYCYTTDTGYTNKCYMHAVPNSGTDYNSNTDYRGVSPELKYYVAFPQKANGVRWYIWIRARGCGSNNDSIHVGLNGQRISTAENMTGWDSCSFVWKSVQTNGSRPYITVDSDLTNFYTLNIWMREDGLRIDQIILSSNQYFTP